MEEGIRYLHEEKNFKIIKINKKPKIFSIDGNIGSGKSKLVSELKKEWGDNPNICFLQEPVSIWESIKDKEGNNILVNYYNNQKKYAFSFQIMAYISRLVLLKNAINSNKYDIIITERSVETDKMVFAKMLYNSNIMEEIEYTIYNMWFEEFLKDLPDFKYIYIKTTANIAHERIIKRNRLGENISLEYLQNSHIYHENWLNNLDSNKVLIINGNIDSNKDLNIIKIWINDIKKFIYSN